MKSLVAFAFCLTACSGAPFTVAPAQEQDPTPLEATVFPPDVAVTPEAQAPEAKAEAPEAGAPTLEASPPDVAPPPLEVEASVLEASSPPPGALCCRLAGPQSASQMCPYVGELTSYPCGTALGSWIYTREGVNSLNGNPQLIDVDCSNSPATMKDVGEDCRWPAGSIPWNANCGNIGTVRPCL